MLEPERLMLAALVLAIDACKNPAVVLAAPSQNQYLTVIGINGQGGPAAAFIFAEVIAT